MERPSTVVPVLNMQFGSMSSLINHHKKKFKIQKTNNCWFFVRYIYLKTENLSSKCQSPSMLQRMCDKKGEQVQNPCTQLVVTKEDINKKSSAEVC